ncbi:MAG TPA: class I SAM-dependent methyltransferase [Actinomycetota bacterium]|nr:class I SAM-dependent methyltransferase [Actinomycetota bacterium]
MSPEKVKRTPSADASRLGEPSYVWRSGQERRLALIRRHVRLEGRRILDVGCGIGTYVRRFRDFSPHVFGIDVSLERVREGASGPAPLSLLVAAGEYLPFAAGSFDVIVFNEVIEHVADDRRTLEDAIRVLAPGGHIVVYAPNRLYPFETHGIFWGRRYRFGNIPLVNYLPEPLRGRLVPHARAYWHRDMRRLVRGLPARLVVHGYVFPGFDNVAARRPRLARLLRAVLYRAERTPLQRFGLSHFVVLQKLGDGGPGGTDGGPGGHGRPGRRGP